MSVFAGSLSANNNHGDKVVDNTGGGYGNQTGDHEAVIEVPLADFGGTAAVEIDGGDIRRVVEDKEMPVGRRHDGKQQGRRQPQGHIDREHHHLDNNGHTDRLFTGSNGSQFGKHGNNNDRSQGQQKDQHGIAGRGLSAFCSTLSSLMELMTDFSVATTCTRKTTAISVIMITETTVIYYYFLMVNGQN